MGALSGLKSKDLECSDGMEVLLNQNYTNFVSSVEMEDPLDHSASVGVGCHLSAIDYHSNSQSSISVGKEIPQSQVVVGKAPEKRFVHNPFLLRHP